MSLPVVVRFRSIFGAARIFEFQSILAQKNNPIDQLWDTSIEYYDGGDIGPPLLQYRSQNLFKGSILCKVAKKCIATKGIYLELGSGTDIHSCIQSVAHRYHPIWEQWIQGSWAFSL